MKTSTPPTARPITLESALEQHFQFQLNQNRSGNGGSNPLPHLQGDPRLLARTPQPPTHSQPHRDPSAADRQRSFVALIQSVLDLLEEEDEDYNDVGGPLPRP
jgi:hypothetical protein